MDPSCHQGGRKRWSLVFIILTPPPTTPGHSEPGHPAAGGGEGQHPGRLSELGWDAANAMCPQSAAQNSVSWAHLKSQGAGRYSPKHPSAPGTAETEKAQRDSLVSGPPVRQTNAGCALAAHQAASCERRVHCAFSPHITTGGGTAVGPIYDKEPKAQGDPVAQP